MWIKQKQTFFLDPLTNGITNQPTLPSAFIFDETYRTKLDKNKFEHNRKFAYFNTVMKIKNKLSNHQHEVYEMVFDPEAGAEDNKYKNLHTYAKKMNLSAVGWKAKQNNESSEKSQELKEEVHTVGTSRRSVKDISFEQNKIHHRRQSELYYDRKPRLDDIMAEYRRLNRKEKQRNNSFIISQKKKVTEQFQLFNRTGRLMPRQFSQPHNQKGKK